MYQAENPYPSCEGIIAYEYFFSSDIGKDLENFPNSKRLGSFPLSLGIKKEFHISRVQFYASMLPNSGCS